MSDIGAHIWTIICAMLLFLLALLIWFFGFWNLQNTLASYNLQDATRTATYLASDNSARTERGAFVINKDKFRDYLDKIHIKQFGNHQLQDSDYQVYYLPDDASADQSTLTGNERSQYYGNFSGNDHNISTNSKTKKSNSSEPWINAYNTDNNKTSDNSTNSGNGYEAIRGIRVVIRNPHSSSIGGTYHSGYGNQSGTSADKQKAIDTFTATDVIQTNGKNSANDTYNDLTR